jgi:GTP-binding protein Era
MDNTTPDGYRSGFVALAGRPNVGKSTLLNALLDQPIAAISPRPQTTRRKQLGILTLPTMQVIFIDAPGIHKPIHLLGEHMNSVAGETLREADLILAMLDASEPLQEDDQRMAERLRALDPSPPTLLVMNKVDLIPSEELTRFDLEAQKILPGVETMAISAQQDPDFEPLLTWIRTHLPEGPQYYDPQQVTLTYERDIAADLIRAAALRVLRDEVPHAIEVRIDEYKERDDHGAYIAATLFVERESQKGIVIGKGGTRLREIGTLARREIEAMSGRQVYLKTRVKVLKGWRNEPRHLRSFGFELRQKRER